MLWLADHSVMPNLSAKSLMNVKSYSLIGVSPNLGPNCPQRLSADNKVDASKEK